MRKLLQRLISIQDLGDIVSYGKYALLLEVGVKMQGVRSKHEGAASRSHAHALQAPRVPSDVMNCDSWRDLVNALVKRHPPGEDFAHHGNDIVDFERYPEMRVTHVTAGRVHQFNVL